MDISCIVFSTFLYAQSFHNKMLGKNLSGGLKVENSGFIPDTLRTTKVLSVIICGGEVTGNNGSCCLFPHSVTSQRSQTERFLIWGRHTGSGPGASSGSRPQFLVDKSILPQFITMSTLSPQLVLFYPFSVSSRTRLKPQPECCRPTCTYGTGFHF